METAPQTQTQTQTRTQTQTQTRTHHAEQHGEDARAEHADSQEHAQVRAVAQVAGKKHADGVGGQEGEVDAAERRRAVGAVERRPAVVGRRRVERGGGAVGTAAVGVVAANRLIAVALEHAMVCGWVVCSVCSFESVVFGVRALHTHVHTQHTTHTHLLTMLGGLRVAWKSAYARKVSTSACGGFVFVCGCVLVSGFQLRRGVVVIGGDGRGCACCECVQAIVCQHQAQDGQGSTQQCARAPCRHCAAARRRRARAAPRPCRTRS